MSQLDTLIGSLCSESHSSNPSYTLSKAQELITLLATGPDIGPQETGKLLSVIQTLCSELQPPALRSAGFEIVTTLCSDGSTSPSEGAAGRAMHITTLERRVIWEALCLSGEQWLLETSTTRLAALEALLGIKRCNDTLQTSQAGLYSEGLDELLPELRRWISNAGDAVISQRDNSEDSQSPRFRSEREEFIIRVDQIIDCLTLDNPALLTEQEVCGLMELYSSWVDRAVRDEFRTVISHSHSAMAAMVSPSLKVPRIHNRNASAATTPTTFNFPSSVVTPSEPTLSISKGFQPESGTRTLSGAKPPYLILAPLFLNLVERFVQRNILIPSQTLQRVFISLCYLLSLTMKALPISASATNDPPATINEATTTPSSGSMRSFNSSSNTNTAVSQSRLSGRTAVPTSLELPITVQGGDSSESTLDGRSMALLDAFYQDKWYASSALQVIRELLVPPRSETGLSGRLLSQSLHVAHGAARSMRFSLTQALRVEVARAQLNDNIAANYAMGGAPSNFGDARLFELSWKTSTSIRFEKIGNGLKEAVPAWRDYVIDTSSANGAAGELVLVEFCGVVADILKLCPDGLVNEVPRFTGLLIQELAQYVRQYRSPDGSRYRLRMSSVTTAPTPLLNSLTDLFRVSLEAKITPPLPSILLELCDHLNDNDALVIITQLQSSSELSPSFPNWADNFRRLINAFCGNARAFPKTRRAIALQLSKVYSEITSIDQEPLRIEIVEDMLRMWEQTLCEESNEEILNIAFDMLSTEIVLATVAADETGEDGAVDWQTIADRIRDLWFKVATTSPPYYESDRLAMIHSPLVPSTGYQSPSVVPTPSFERSQNQLLHNPSPSLPLNSINATLTSATPHFQAMALEEGDSQTLAQDDLSREQNQGTPQNSDPAIQPRKGQAVLAVTFLITAFNKLAFRSPQSLRILLSDASRPQSASAARMAIGLFRNIVQLVGTEPIDGKEEHNSHPNEQPTRVQCPKARLLILQWLLRLRADRDHKVYGVNELDNEVLPMARLIYRAERSRTDDLNAERGDKGLPSELAERRRKRAETKGTNDLRPHRALERDRGREGASRDPTREPRARGHTEALSASASRSRSRPPVSPRTKFSIPRPQEILWCLPEFPGIEWEKHAMRPSPAMATFASVSGEDGTFWLHVDYYVQTLCDILENEKDWEVVSYLLCHLPLQLANKHFFCGPKTKIQIRRLVLVICNAINDDKLHSNQEYPLPPSLPQVNVQALLYHTLTVLISYHRIFDTDIGESDQTARSIKADIVEVIFRGLARDEVTNKPCLEALSLAVYELPEQVAKFTAEIIEKLSRIMSNPNMAVHILEVLVVIGYTPKLYSGSFREEEYRRVFGVALQYIQHHYRPDAKTLRTTDGRESYALAQHVLNTAFFVIYLWFLSIKLEERHRYVPFITKQLLIANSRKDSIEPSSEVCFDWLARYAYSNADPKAAPSFLYRSVVAPSAGAFNVNRSWDELQKHEMENASVIKAWKLGNSIVTISTMKKPPGWIRIVSRRPSGLTELVCRVENWPHVGPGDFAPDLVSMPVTMLASRPEVEVDGDGDESLDVDEDYLNTLISNIVEQSDVIQDIQKPDPISGYVWSGVAPSQRRKEVMLDPAYIALLLSAYPAGMVTRPSRFPDYNALKDTLRVIDFTPVIDTHKVGVLYVAPGQTTEAEILHNRHGSPAYTRFLAELGRIIKPSNQLEIYTGGLRPETHGEFAYAWWDDMSQIIYHVATIMPNINNCLYKKQEIGNDGVKIVWNDGGTPFKFDMIPSEFTQINVVVEPHSIGARGAFSDNRHENEFFKVTLQTAPSLPRITPIGDFKIISAEKLSMALRHFTLLASLFCRTWAMTGQDGPNTVPLETPWQQRLKYIRNSERKLPAKPEDNDQDQNASLVNREASRDFTIAY
ncbi:Tuberous sclerosis 2-like protein [Serendipita sp. 405]|nr:Tuberous sclerosis 2-like protein [Serendipita sp. 405]